LLSSRGGESVVDFTRTSLRQGFVEKSNINPILEMSRLISVTRSFEALTASNDQSDKRLADAIRTLSGSRG
jgi:flagellar basal-body rod protein FlgF